MFYLNLLSFPLPLSDHLSLVINLLIRVIQLKNKSFIIINSFFNYVHIEDLIRLVYIMKSHGDSGGEIVSEWDNLSLVIHLLIRVIQLENGSFIIFIFRDLIRLVYIMYAVANNAGNSRMTLNMEYHESVTTFSGHSTHNFFACFFSNFSKRPT